VQQDRQWFTVGGLVGLSDTKEPNCADGLAVSESGLSGTDILIDIGIAIVGGTAGYFACKDKPFEEASACMQQGASVGALLLSARTVRYRCNMRPSAAVIKPAVPAPTSVSTGTDEGPSALPLLVPAGTGE